MTCSQSALYVGAPWRGLQGEADQNQGVVYRVPWSEMPDRSSLGSVGTMRRGPTPEAGFGMALSALSLAGRTALLVGAPGHAGNGTRRGRVELLVEDDGVLQTVASIAGQQDGEQFGRIVLATDLDDDGVDDVVLGTPDHADDGRLDVGRLWLWRSAAVQDWSGAINRETADQIIGGTHAFQRVGRKLSRSTVDERAVLLIPTRAGRTGGSGG